MRIRPIPLVMAVGALATSFGFLVSHAIRQASPVYLDLGRVSFAWHAALLAGAGGIIHGLLSRKPKTEAAGLVLVAGGMLMYVIGSFVSRGLSNWTSGVLLGASSLSSLLRAYALTQGRQWS